MSKNNRNGPKLGANVTDIIKSIILLKQFYLINIEHFDGLVQNFCNFIILHDMLQQFCTNASMCMIRGKINPYWRQVTLNIYLMSYRPSLELHYKQYATILLKLATESSIFLKWFCINFCPALSTNEITWNADFIFIEPLRLGPLTEIDTGPDIENPIAILSVVDALLKDNKVFPFYQFSD